MGVCDEQQDTSNALLLHVHLAIVSRWRHPNYFACTIQYSAAALENCVRGQCFVIAVPAVIAVDLSVQVTVYFAHSTVHTSTHVQYIVQYEYRAQNICRGHRINTRIIFQRVLLLDFSPSALSKFTPLWQRPIRFACSHASSKENCWSAV